MDIMAILTEEDLRAGASLVVGMGKSSISLHFVGQLADFSCTEADQEAGEVIVAAVEEAEYKDLSVWDRVEL